MCSLKLGLRGQEPQDVLLPCDVVEYAVAWTENLAARAAWPRNEVARLELWPGHPPLVLRLDEVFSCCVELCEQGFARLNPEPAKEDAHDEPEA